MKAGIKQFIKMVLTWCCGGNNLLSVMLKNVIGGGNSLYINRSARLRHCHFIIRGRQNHLFIDEGCNLTGLRILLEGDNNSIHIGKNVIVNASTAKPTVMNAVEGTNIFIGDECLFSNNIEIHTSDYHSILSIDSFDRINPAKDICLEERVWVGLRSIILKGTHLSSDTIVGAGSVVAGNFKESNVIIVGCPACIRKNNIKWVPCRT